MTNESDNRPSDSSDPNSSSNDAFNKIRRIAEAFQIPKVIKKYAEQEKITEAVASEHAKELKRFLIVCAACSNNSYSIAGPTDVFWHTFILHTQEYSAFCEAIAGDYLHHVPSGNRDAKRSGVETEDRVDMLKRYVRFLSDYELLFGESPPPHVWPKAVLSGTTGAKVDCFVWCLACQEA